MFDWNITFVGGPLLSGGFLLSETYRNISNLTVLFWQALQTGAVIFAIHSLGSEPPYRINQVLRYYAQYICSHQGAPLHVHLNGVAEAAEQGEGWGRQGAIAHPKRKFWGAQLPHVSVPKILLAQHKIGLAIFSLMIFSLTDRSIRIALGEIIC